MTRAAPLRCALAGLLLAGAAGAVAQPIDVAALQRLLQQTPPRELHFRETRESPWLAAPVESSGRLRASATMLEKKIEQPRRETWQILPDRMLLSAPGASAPKALMFRDAPAVAALANALRQVMTGELQALARDFRLVPGGDERLWTLQATPRQADIARFLRQIELQGSGTQLQVIVVLESQGERSTLRLNPEP